MQAADGTKSKNENINASGVNFEILEALCEKDGFAVLRETLRLYKLEEELKLN